MFCAGLRARPLGRGYAAVPVPGSEGPVRLTLVVRTVEHPDGPGVLAGRAGAGVAGDGYSLVGAVTDAKGHVLRFVDVWFHDPSSLVQRMVAAEGALNNT